MRKLRPSHPGLSILSLSQRIQDATSLGRRLIHWGCCTPPLAALAPHYVLIGTPGSGKTVLLKLLLKSALIDSDLGLIYRAALFDPKRELYPFLLQSGLSPEHIIMAHPYDTRSAAWHLPDDFTDASHAQTLADAIIPRRPQAPEAQDKKNADFWVNASNQTVLDVILALIQQTPQDWDLRDVTEACSDPDIISQMLKLTPSGRDTHRFYYAGRTELANDVLATLRSFVRELEPLAALWHNAETTFSIRQWRAGSGLLLLGSEPERPHLLRTVNTLLIRRMSQVLLAQLDERPPDLTWLFFDELREAGRFDGFQSLLTNGRSKGVRVAQAFQDTFGLNAAFGSDEAKEILAICANKAILHLGSPEAAQWASDLFHEREREVQSWTTNDDLKMSRSTKVERVREVLPIQFHELSLAENNNGAIEAYFHHPGLAYRGALPAAAVQALLPLLTKEAMASLPAAFIERPRAQQERIPWDNSDFARVGIRPTRSGARPDGTRNGLKVMSWHKENVT